MAFNHIEYNNRYAGNHYKEVALHVKKDEKQEWKEYVKAKGISMTEFFRNAIMEYTGMGDGNV